MPGGFPARKKKRAEKIRQVEISKAYEEQERKKGPGSDPLLYICTFELYNHGTAGFSAGYCVYTIRVSDLNGSDDKPRPDKLREVANLQGPGKWEHLPLHMGFAVFGSRIVLAGGLFLHPKKKHPIPTYVLETDPTEEPNPSFIISTTSSSRPRYMIPQLKGHKKSRIWLREIDGKLYALSGERSRQMNFQVFDPKAKPEWDRLPAPPFVGDDWTAFYYYSSCVVVGTKVILTTKKKEREFKTLCFDVAHPERQWKILETPCSDPRCASPRFYNQVLVLDVKEDQDGFDKLMFTFDSQIRVSRMKLSDEGVPVSVESVAAQLDLPDNCGIEPTSYNFAHLGDQTVCFASLDMFTLYVITFNFTYAPFSHKFLGRMFNIFNSPEELSWINIGGCFVL